MAELSYIGLDRRDPLADRRKEMVMELKQILARLEKVESDLAAHNKKMGEEIEPMLKEIYEIVKLGKSTFRVISAVAWVIHKLFKWAAPILAVGIAVYGFIHSGFKSPPPPTQ